MSCESNDTTFGKQYNAARRKYGSPIIHDYMTLKNTDEDFELWRMPQEIHDTITTGFHAGKGFYTHKDSVLQEDDIFRKRINDSTFAFVAILTFGNLKDNKFTSIYYDSVDERELMLRPTQFDDFKKYKTYSVKYLTIIEADSILSSWGTSRYQ